MRDVLAHRGPDDAGLYVDARRPRPPPAEHRRSRGRPSAADERRRQRLDRLQRRDLQPRRRAGRTLEARGHRLPHPIRHRDHRPRLRAVGRRCVEHLRGMFAFALWDAPAGACCWRAIASASSRSTGRAGDRSCLRPRSSRSSRAAWSAPRPTSRALPELLSTRYLSGAETLFAASTGCSPATC